MSTSEQKKNTIDRISTAVFRLEMTKGHLKWKVSDLARLAKVSRPLVYLYLGKTKQDILSNSIDNFVNEFYGLQEVTTTYNITFDSVLAAKKVIAKNPEAMVFYLTWRHRSSWINDKFQQVEKAFQKKLSSVFPELKSKDILFLYVILHGLTTAPFLDVPMTEEAVNMLLKNYKKP